MAKHWSPPLPTATYGHSRCGINVGAAVEFMLDVRKVLDEKNVTLLLSTLSLSETDGMWGWTAEGADRTKARDHVDDGPCWCGGPDGPRVPWVYDKTEETWKPA